VTGGATLGVVSTLARYPVKSLVGEQLSSVEVDRRGLVGDRLWAVCDPDGKLGSGKSSRRFRKMAGLLDLAARYDDQDVEQQPPVVDFPDGRSMRGGEAELDQALSAHVGRPVALHREDEVDHFDEGPLHLLTSSSVARLAELHGSPVDPRHFRANMLVDTGSDSRFDEDEWTGRTLRIGDRVLVRVREPMTRCVMVGLRQVDLAADDRLLNTIGQVNGTMLGLVVDVLRPGTITVGDRLVEDPALH
jgi:uncharacterized protein